MPAYLIPVSARFIPATSCLATASACLTTGPPGGMVMILATTNKPWDLDDALRQHTKLGANVTALSYPLQCLIEHVLNARSCEHQDHVP